METRLKKPKWLKVRGFAGAGYDQVSNLIKNHGLRTVCQAANCPNRGECFNRGTATFLIMGSKCTRNCSFCDITAARPSPLNPREPQELAEMALALKLRHVVVTSVTRDDLPDGGASHFAETVRQLRCHLPDSSVELLTPDFRRAPKSPDIIIKAAPDVFNHNVETVPRLYRTVRPGADYGRSLDLLKYMGDHSEMVIKSGLMLGLGETRDELLRVFDDLVAHKVSVLTMGQYLAPSKDHHPVIRYVPPEEFDSLGEVAKQAGLRHVQSGPLVRSSYRAELFRSV